MKTVEQKVEMYYSMLSAKEDMKKHIDFGWRVHTCTMGVYAHNGQNVLVVYEKKLFPWS